MTKTIKTQEQIAEAKAKKAAYDKARRERMKAEKAGITAEPLTHIVANCGGKSKILQAMDVNTSVMSPETSLKQTKSKKEAWRSKVDFTGAVEVNRKNVKTFYKKTGYIHVVNENGDTIHIGKTTNMGKVFSNYVNCDRYNQAYKCNLEGTDRLLFKETSI